MKATIIRVIILFVGLIIAHFGVLLFVGRSYIKIGTLICLSLVGPVAGFFLPRSQKIVESFVKCKK